MLAVVLWTLGVIACALMVLPATRSAGMFATAAATMSLFMHYDFATIPEARYVAVLLWAAASLLFVANLRAGRQGRTA